MSYKITGNFTYHTLETVYENPILDLKVDLTSPTKINVELLVKIAGETKEVVKIDDVENFTPHQWTNNLYEDFNVSLHQTLYAVLQNDNPINASSNFEII
jgi:hypothetical protein